MKKLNVLVFDDNAIVGKNIAQRMIALDEKAMSSNSPKPRLNITYIDGSKYPYYDYKNCPELIEELRVCLEKADYLMSDIHIQDFNLLETFKVSNKEIYINIDESANDVDFNGLTESAKNYLQGFSYQAADIYKQLSFETIQKVSKKLKKIIVYTYSPNSKSNELPQKARFINEALKVSNKTDVFSSHKELYEAADFDLYKTRRINNELVAIGLKCDFGLYGAALGEILYHKIMDNEAELFNVSFKKSKKDYQIGLLIYFFMFLSIDMGGNALFDMLKEKQVNAFTIALLALFFGLLIPLFVLYLRPSLLIWVNSKEENE